MTLELSRCRGGRYACYRSRCGFKSRLVSKWAFMNKVSFKVIHTLLAVALLTFWVGFSRETNGQIKSITSPRPLADFADRLQSDCLKIVTYEEPLLVHGADLQLYQGSSVGPKMRTFDPPTITATNLDLSTLRYAIDAYNGQHDLPYFRVISSNYGLHIVPESRRNEEGKSEPAISLLDSVVTLPTATRTPWETFKAFCQAVAVATGVKVQAHCPVLGVSPDQLFTAGEDPILSWGVESQNARTALIDLLAHSATSMSWRLNCQPKSQYEDAFCVLSISPIVVTGIDNKGKHFQKLILYDRCGDCPKIRRPPPPPPE
jgi:hypothetical protein